MSEKLLGDHIEDVAKAWKIDQLVKHIERLTKQNCGCGNRKEKLNALHLQLRDLRNGGVDE